MREGNIKRRIVVVFFNFLSPRSQNTELRFCTAVACEGVGITYAERSGLMTGGRFSRVTGFVGRSPTVPQVKTFSHYSYSPDADKSSGGIHPPPPTDFYDDKYYIRIQPSSRLSPFTFKPHKVTGDRDRFG